MTEKCADHLIDSLCMYFIFIDYTTTKGINQQKSVHTQELLPLKIVYTNSRGDRQWMWRISAVV